jgi:hypothetical protein
LSLPLPSLLSFVKNLGPALAANVGVLLLVSPDAFALGPVGLEVGAKVGAGIPLNNGSAPNLVPAMGFGVGGRVGVTLFDVYAGFSGVYYFGDTKNLSENGLHYSASAHTLMLGAELGYNIKLPGLLTLRPQLGLGNNEIYGSAQSTVPNTLPTPSQSNGYFYLEPALVALADLRGFYVGADVGARMLPEGPALDGCSTGPGSCHSFHIAFTAHAQVGVRF